MHVLAIYAVYEHISELMAEAEQARRAKEADSKPKRGFRSRVASLFSGRDATPAPASSALANS